LTSPFSFTGKRVVMTGAFSGMGRAAAEYLIADGAEVHALDVKPLEYEGATFYQLDLNDPAAIDEVSAAVAKAVPDIDILLHCAGLPHSSFPYDQIFHVNFIGLRRLNANLLPNLHPGASIGIIASKSGINWPSLQDTLKEVIHLDDAAAVDWFEKREDLHSEAYGFSKACVLFWALNQTTPLGEKGIRINCIAPGATDTPMMDHFRKGRTVDQLNKATGTIGRMSRPEEQAYPLLFLVSDAASYISGVNIVVDAGALAGFVTGQLTPPDVAAYKKVDESGAIST
jgi:NAD(P)-dependent dehydrogenase (short-subunit alcohol dehydrogenase family)